MTFYICKHCGNIITKIKDSSVPVMCCNENMQEIIANTTDAAVEKHIPKVSKEGNVITVSVGSTLHPMTEEHLIEWICIKTTNSYQLINLQANDNPTVTITTNEDIKEVYAYCNLHGLWKK